MTTVEVICGELRTGRILTTVPAADSSWSTVLNDAGRVSCEVPLDDLSLADARELVGYLDPARCYLATRVGDRILEAGPIWRHNWDEATRVLHVEGAGLWSLFDHRVVMDVLAAGEDPASTTLTWSALSLGTIAKRLVEKAEAHTGGSLPVTFPDDEAAANDEDHQRTYPGYSLKNLGAALRDLTHVLNGPDVAFQPALSEDRLSVEWEMRTGTEAEPLLYQTGDDWRWHTSTPLSGISGLSVGRDGTGMAHRAYVPGSGMEAALPIGFEEDLTDVADLVGYPLLEAVESHSSVTVQGTLDAHAQALVARSVRPWMTWAWDAHVDTFPTLGEYRPGDWATVTVPDDHPYLSALGVVGDYRTRILGVSGGLGDFVTITAAPTLEAR